MEKQNYFGWLPDLPDPRDYRLLSLIQPHQLPKSVNLQAQMPPVYNQGALGSCTANAIGAAFRFCLMKENIRNFEPSRLFIYYNERVIEHSVRTDAGAQLRDGVKSLNKEGVCSESSWPYDISKFARRPLKACYLEALKHPVTSYQRIGRSLDEMKSCLAEGFPFVFGFSVFETFESAEVATSGIVQMPQRNERLLGGHAVICVGYDDKSHRFRLLNSWGSDWGQKGYFTMPYEYLLDENLSDDFWTLRLVK